MRPTRHRRGIATALFTAVLLAAAACGSDPDSGTNDATPAANVSSESSDAGAADDPGPSPDSEAADSGAAGSAAGGESAQQQAPPADNVTLHVWMQGDTLKDIGIETLNAEFEAAHPGVTIDLQEQTWSEYTTKVTTGLADTSGNAPDVLELGNTQVAQFAAAGALMELDASDFDNSDSWLTGLAESATYDGTLVAVPYYAGVRVGIYRTDLAKEAGVEPPFDSLDDLQAAGVKLLETHGDDGSFSGLYFPSQYWYEGLSFIWDAGGDIATQNDDGSWTATLDSAEARAGLQRLKDLVDATSRGGEGTNEADDALVMAQGQAAMFIDASWKPAVVSDPDSGNPDLKDKVGIFVVPGSEPGSVLPQFLGGSDIAVNVGTPHADLAKEYTQLLTGKKYQQVLAGKGYIANSTAYQPKAGDQNAQIVMRAASNGRFVPNSENWGKVEAANVLPNMFDDILSGSASIEDATAAANAKIDELLNS